MASPIQMVIGKDKSNPLIAGDLLKILRETREREHMRITLNSQKHNNSLVRVVTSRSNKMATNLSNRIITKTTRRNTRRS